MSVGHKVNKEREAAKSRQTELVLLWGSGVESIPEGTLYRSERRTQNSQAKMYATWLENSDWIQHFSMT